MKWFVFVALLVVTSGVAHAADLWQWSTGTGANGHYYEVCQWYGTEFVSWDTARSMAYSKEHAGLSGHLATFTSADEWNQVAGHLTGGTGADYWLGGWQPNGATEVNAGDGWSWVTGEAWMASGNPWILGEPNNGGSSTPEHVLAARYRNSAWGWNDAPNEPLSFGMVVEYDGLSDTATPEPASFLLLGLSGFAGLAVRRRRKS